MSTPMQVLGEMAKAVNRLVQKYRQYPDQLKLLPEMLKSEIDHTLSQPSLGNLDDDNGLIDDPDEPLQDDAEAGK